MPSTTHRTDSIAYQSILALIFLLPIFFLPTAIVPLGLAKSGLLLVGGFVVFALLLAGAFRKRGFSVPGNLIMWAALALPAVYLVSALVSGARDVSLFGYGLEMGTAGAIVILSALFLGTALVFRSHARLIRALSALFVSLGLLAIYAVLKIATGGSFLTLGVLQGSVGNPLGSWTDLGVAFALLAILTTFAVEMLPLSAGLLALTSIFYVLSLILLSIINFTVAWYLALAAAVILLVYFATVARGAPLSRRPGVWMAGVVLVLSLLFIANPSIGGSTLSQRVASITSVANSDVRPNLNSTLSVGRAVLGSQTLLGSGPNTFDRQWLLFRSSDTNATPFWNTAFPFGFGFLPTALATTGLLGALVWTLFLLSFIWLGVKALARSPESASDRFMLASTFLTALFLWAAAFLYVPSAVVLALAFVSTGLFVGASEASGILGERRISFDRSKVSHFAAVLAMILLAAGTLAFGYSSAKKMVAAFHFEEALAYSSEGKSLNEIESELGKAITASASDPYWGAVSQVELARANAAANDTKASDKDRQATFQNSLSAAIAAAQNAIALSPTYGNWVALGNIYGSLVPAPLSVAGAYEAAKNAYAEAGKRNPQSPEIPLLLAKLELDKGSNAAARADIADALGKKQDYADAYFLLSQLEVKENNLNQAIKSAETGVVLSPNNPGVLFELGLLKYANRDYSGAASALDRALALVPNYANAKYYLGLADDQLGKRSEALALFEDLNTTNPGNQLVLDVLVNLRAGRNALYQAPPAKSAKSAPISGR